MTIAIDNCTDASSKPRAYSYVRFSTPEQAKGDSFRRQTAMAQEYAIRKGLELDDTLKLQDLGVSAFRGDNAATGALSLFKEAVEAGEVPHGSYLLVESLDRISRDKARIAQRALEDIAETGITVVTLCDEKEYSAASMNENPFDLILSLVIFIRANEESATKARRLRAAWQAKRDSMADTPLTGRTPGWVTLDSERQALSLIPERAAIVKRIFEETIAGKGQWAIARSLTEDGVEPWGKALVWHRTYISKIQSNPAVIGAFTPHTLEHEGGKKVRLPQATNENYFPAAISKELWLEAQNILGASKHPRTRGRHAHRPIVNMLAGIASCPKCRGTMTRVTKGVRSLPKYVCAGAKVGSGCRYRSVSVEAVEAAIKSRLLERLRSAPAGERKPDLGARIQELDLATGALVDELERLVEAVAKNGGSPTLFAAIRDKEAALETANMELEALRKQKFDASGATVAKRIERLIAVIETKGSHEDINAALARVFRDVVIDYEEGLLIFEWAHGGETELPFALPENIDRL